MTDITVGIVFVAVAGVIGYLLGLLTQDLLWRKYRAKVEQREDEHKNHIKMLNSRLKNQKGQYYNNNKEKKEKIRQILTQAILDVDSLTN